MKQTHQEENLRQMLSEKLTRQIEQAAFYGARSPASMEFPPLFTAVHRDMMEQMYYSHGPLFEIKVIDPLHSPMLPSLLTLVGVQAEEVQGKVEFRPFSSTDRIAAKLWEGFYCKYEASFFETFNPMKPND